MSEDSSSLNTAKSASTLPGWLLAVLVLLSTIFLFVAAQVIGQVVISIYPALQHWSSDEASAWVTNSVGAQFAYGLIADGLLVGGVALMMHRIGWRWSTIGLKIPLARNLLIGLIATIPYYLLYVAMVVAVSVIVPTLNIEQKQQIGFNSVHGPIALLLTFASLVVIPPLAEEITMRGFLYTGLRKWLPKIAAGLLVSGLFGAAHLAEGGDAGPLWIGAIDTFTLSLVLVYLREKTGSLWAGIVLHATKNLVAFTMLFLIGGR